MVFRSAELLQNFMPDRVPRLSDAMEKLFGGQLVWRWVLFPNHASCPEPFTGNYRPQLD
jgi:hypothetical protein